MPAGFSVKYNFRVEQNASARKLKILDSKSDVGMRWPGLGYSSSSRQVKLSAVLFGDLRLPWYLFKTEQNDAVMQEQRGDIAMNRVYRDPC